MSSKLFIMNSPFTDLIATETENYYDHYDQQDELLRNSPFEDRFMPAEYNFENINSFENEESEMQENFSTTAWLQQAIDANEISKIELGWGKYLNGINDMFGGSAVQSSKKLSDPAALAFGVLNWQKRNGFTGEAANGIIDSTVWNMMREFIKPKPVSSPVCDLVIAVPDFSISQRQMIEPVLLNPQASKTAIKLSKQNFEKFKIDPKHILTDLERYVDIQLVELEIVKYNKANQGKEIDPGTAPVNAVFVEAMNQFQRKIFIPKIRSGKENKGKVFIYGNNEFIYGTADYGSLHSLGIIHFEHTAKLGLNTCAKNNLKRLAIKVPLNGKECSYANWSDFTFNPSFMGFGFNSPVHYLLIKQLRIAESYLLTLPKFKGNSITEMAQKMGYTVTTSENKGGRTTECGMHTFGLAVDIRYDGNPYIYSVSTQLGKKVNFMDSMRKAFLSRHGSAVPVPAELKKSTAAAFLDSIGLRKGANTYDAYDELKERNDEFIFLMNSNSDELSGWAESSTFKPLKKGKPGISRNPVNGFLNLDRDLVYALRQVAGLAWGAIDFGGGSGDIMHFDLRAIEPGRRINVCKITPDKKVSKDPVETHPLLKAASGKAAGYSCKLQKESEWDVEAEGSFLYEDDVNNEPGEWNEHEEWENDESYCYENNKDNEQMEEESMYESSDVLNEFDETEGDNETDLPETENREEENFLQQYEYDGEILDETSPVMEHLFPAPASGTTHYLKVSAGGGLPANTGAYIPASFKSTSGNLDIVVFLHGNMPDAEFQKTGIDHYWNNYANIRDCFRQQMPNAILLAPTLGSLPGTQFGSLANENEFENFVSSCIWELKKLKKLAAMAIPYRIVLAAHGEGGNAMGQILAHKNGLDQKITEVWGFDCLYGETKGSWVNNYAKWLTATKGHRPTKVFYHYWAQKDDAPAKRGEELQRLSPGRIKNIAPSKDVSHKDIIEQAWLNEINKRPFLDFFDYLKREKLEVQARKKTIQAKIIEIATRELATWSGKKETDTGMQEHVKRYWRASERSETEINDIIQQRTDDIAKGKTVRHPWSSAFVTFVMRAASDKLFLISSAHNRYVAWAKKNKNDISDIPFYAYRINEVVVEVGDIIVNARTTKGQLATYDNIEKKPEAHGDMVIEIDAVNKRAKVFGGNKNRDVSSAYVNLTDEGKVLQVTQKFAGKTGMHDKYIGVIKLLPDLATAAVAPTVKEHEFNDGALFSRSFINSFAPEYISNELEEQYAYEEEQLDELYEQEAEHFYNTGFDDTAEQENAEEQYEEANDELYNNEFDFFAPEADTVLFYEDVKVRAGETLIGLAAEYGFDPDDWREIWDDPKNAALKTKRKLSTKIKEGDILFFPIKWRITSAQKLAPAVSRSGIQTFNMTADRSGKEGGRVDWVQTVYGHNQPKFTEKPFPAFSVDLPTEDDDPFYWTQTEYDQSSANRKQISDTPGRTPRPDLGATNWRAVTSLCTVTHKRVSIWNTFVWGVNFNPDGKNTAYPIRPASDDEINGHLNLLRKKTGRSGKTYTSLGWTFRDRNKPTP